MLISCNSVICILLVFTQGQVHTVLSRSLCEVLFWQPTQPICMCSKLGEVVYMFVNIYDGVIAEHCKL